jgi:hypothetical protein
MLVLSLPRDYFLGVLPAPQTDPPVTQLGEDMGQYFVGPVEVNPSPDDGLDNLRHKLQLLHLVVVEVLVTHRTSEEGAISHCLGVALDVAAGSPSRRSLNREI